MSGSEEALRRAAELEAAGYEAFRSGDAERSRELNEQSLELARAAADAPAEARALAGLMRLCLRAHDFEQLERLAVEGERVASRAADPSLRRMPLHMRAEAARLQGDLAAAARLYDESIALNRSLGNGRMVGVELANKSWVEINIGRLDEAEALLRESLAQPGVDDAYSRAFVLLGLARIALQRGEAGGVALLDEADGLLAGAGLVWDPAEEPEYRRTRALADELGAASGS